VRPPALACCAVLLASGVVVAGCGTSQVGDPPVDRPDAAAPPPDAGPVADAPSPPPPPPPDAEPDASVRSCNGGDDRIVDPRTGTCYLYFADALSWDDARAACQALGGDLAVPTSSSENLILALLVPSTANAWLGGTDFPNEGTWRWVTGEPFVFANWRSGEPNDGNSTTRDEDCNVLEANNNGVWDDRDCVRLFPYTCEIP